MTNILLSGKLAVNLEITINVSKLKFNNTEIISARLKDINEINIVINPSIIFIPKRGLANTFEIKNVNDKLLNLYIIIGIIAIWADIVTDKTLEILLFILILFRNISAFLLNSIIPIVPKYESSSPISLIENGFIIRTIRSDIEMLVQKSCFRYNKFPPKTIIAIKHALVTDAVKLVIHINKIKPKIVSEYTHLFDILLLFKINVNPSIIYDVCAPDTESICDKLLILKSSIISSDIPDLSPIKIPTNKLLVFSGKSLFDELVI